MPKTVSDIVEQSAQADRAAQAQALAESRASDGRGGTFPNRAIAAANPQAVSSTWDGVCHQEHDTNSPPAVFV